MSKRHAIGIVSGGLDSLLATKVVQRMGIDVTALHFVIGFEPRHLKNWFARPDDPPTPSQAMLDTGAQVEVLDIRKDYMPLLAAPPHGYGGNCNPCIDCHAMMLHMARKRMLETGAAFVFSGEVLGQRPMSQNRRSLDIVAAESALEDHLVRPLSGALLPTTAPEREGVFSRKDLLDIKGRSRKRQTELAREFKLSGYPSPAGGCLLTDPQFSSRLSDLFERRPDRILRIDDPLLLFVGRHIVLPDGAKLVVGRHHEENLVIERFADRGVGMVAEEVMGPMSLVEVDPAKPPSEADLLAAARLTARYGKGHDQSQVRVTLTSPDGSQRTIAVEPGEPEGRRIL